MISVPLSCQFLHNRSSPNQSNKNSSSYVQCFCKKKNSSKLKGFSEKFPRYQNQVCSTGLLEFSSGGKISSSTILLLSSFIKEKTNDDGRRGLLARGDCLIPLRRAGSSTEPPASVYQRLIHGVYLTMCRKYSEACSVLYFTSLDVSV